MITIPASLRGNLKFEQVTPLGIEGVILIAPLRLRDARGFFSETYHRAELSRIGIDAEFVQDNHSLSLKPGTVRGLHFQAPPHAQQKLIRVCRGAIFDVVVDIRHGSPTYGKAVSVVLSDDNWHQLWIPKGLAHGFCTLEPNTEVVYKVTDFYAPECDKGLAWDDPELAIEWPVTREEAILSEKDRGYPQLSELPTYFQVEHAVT
jgi:dTDP-4-dehydrorhamnose 3,5-epimerase